MGKSIPIQALTDLPMWQSIEEGALKLQFCSDCDTCRYPPAPICPSCLSMDSEWRPVTGEGTVMSWVIFHRKYFDDFPPPYNAMAVRLDEGPIIVTNLLDPVPGSSLIGRRIKLEYVDHDGRKQHGARLKEAD
ncbi:hypothetical protein GCM10011360_41510 [Primorskyibacter flagellatus]|uniref:Nucleic-acid-binding protein containing a Zn-ribbon n=1 Tax=Primorskyibacter flagellatus TaxID=1387277 RepID=A0A917AG88_9RHOB|nr:OB-fold domain-containing protein [Primorskyibacter flagellatus]GGE50183.1 hypothetical protein GCM10011360_41510 [Primorskyibacter flagellatus]